MTTDSDGSNGTSRTDLEERANTVMTELLRRLDELEDRRHRLARPGALLKLEVRRHLPIAAAAGVGALALGALVLYVYRARREREFRREALRRVLVRLFGEGALPPTPARSVAGKALRSAGLGLLALVWKEVGQRTLWHWLDAGATERRSAPPPLLEGRSAGYR